MRKRLLFGLVILFEEFNFVVVRWRRWADDGTKLRCDLDLLTSSVTSLRVEICCRMRDCS